MGFRKFRKRRRGRPGRRRRGGKKKYKVSTAKLRDKKINTLFEIRAKQIAKAEVRKQHPSLVFRKYILGQYLQAHNEWDAGTRLDWAGVSYHPCQIPLTDAAAIVQSGVVVDPLFPMPLEDQANQFGRPFGINVVATQFSQDGFRLGYKIKISSITMQLRAHMDVITDIQQLFDDVYVKYSLVSFHDAATPLQAVKLAPEDGMSMKRWGYVSKIDTLEREKIGDTCHLRYWGSGGFNIRCKPLTCTQKFITKRWNLKGLNYEYASNDPSGPHAQSQYGQRVLGPKLFIILRCTTPVAANVQYKPKIHCCVKVNYTNET